MPVHLYIHVPFCARRCSYCDFAIAVRRVVPSETFAGAILREWEGWQSHEAWTDSPDIATVYFGGGTPSRLDPSAIDRIIDRIGADRTILAGAEITLEANPDDVTADRAAAWRAAGLTRISLGVQSFDPRVLAWMHRTHSAEQVPAAVGVLRDAGFDNLSLDLIFALPSELGRDWPADLDQAIALDPEHLSLYGLTVEPHTPLGHWTARGAVRPLGDDAYAADFLHADRRMRSAGFEHYEVSNAALPGRRARHNSAYWRRAPFIGLGPSAHSGFGTARQWNVRDWAAYERALQPSAGPRDAMVGQAGSGRETLAVGRQALVAGRESLAADALRLEQLYLGLRTTDGVPAELIPQADAARWQAEGWALVGDRVRLTAEGWLRLDALVASVG